MTTKRETRTEDPRIEAVAELLRIKFCFPRWGYPYAEGECLEDAREILAAADAAAWRPISELEDETYILAFSSGRMTTAFWFDKEDWGGPFWTDGVQQLRNITHFMPLPTPPQEQDT